MSSRTGGGPLKRSADVIVIGAGVIGLAIAWRSACRGLSVTVVDPAPGSGSSHVAAGMLAPVSEAGFGETQLLHLNLASWRGYPAFVRELEVTTGRSTGYRQTGSLAVARDADDNAVLEREYRYRLSLGLRVQRLSGAECRSLEPGLAPSVRGGVRAAGDHQVDPRALVDVLLAACAASGVAFARSRASLRMSGGCVSGVSLQDGREVAASAVVLAAGCWSSEVEGLPARAGVRVRPVKGQILRLSGRSATPVLRQVIRGLDAYAVPRADGSLVVGATVEERGFDTMVTAGGVYTLLRDARELVPDVLELDLTEASAGLRPGTHDNVPLIGETAVPGLIAATGHHRNGVLLAPITADVVVALLTAAPPPLDVSPFSPARLAPVAPVPA